MAYTTDPIADLLTRIRNANRANHDALEISSSQAEAGDRARSCIAKASSKASTSSSRRRRTRSRSP